MTTISANTFGKQIREAKTTANLDIKRRPNGKECHKTSMLRLLWSTSVVTGGSHDPAVLKVKINMEIKVRAETAPRLLIFEGNWPSGPSPGRGQPR
jgi:hypothetical protein